MTEQSPVNIFWFRRDLRIEDNHGLSRALSGKIPVLPVFIFDRTILETLPDPSDPRVSFIYENIKQLKIRLQKIGSDIKVFYGYPTEVWKDILSKYKVHNVFTNHDYEPYARKRDKEIKDLLTNRDIPFYSFKDQVIFEKSDILKSDGKPYTIFTPYSRQHKLKLTVNDLQSYSSEKLVDNFLKMPPSRSIGLEEMGFKKSGLDIPDSAINSKLISEYDHKRDYPAVDGTSRLGIHLRFGTISIRKLYQAALDLNETFVNELIWREFFMQILWHFPYVEKSSFRKEYDKIKWLNDPKDFETWKKGTTGFPIVDAGMRELNATGFMHNRVRMITASFLVKDLLIDWRLGEHYFAEKLLDFELASNNGNWQWAAGCGCDAAPYFRVFNPYLQAQKFDPQNIYIKKWVPEYGTGKYPKPMVDHSIAVRRVKDYYSNALKK